MDGAVGLVEAPVMQVWGAFRRPSVATAAAGEAVVPWLSLSLQVDGHAILEESRESSSVKRCHGKQVCQPLLSCTSLSDEL